MILDLSIFFAHQGTHHALLHLVKLLSGAVFESDTFITLSSDDMIIKEV
jgi:hypothetical protein